MNLIVGCEIFRFYGWSTFANPEGQRKLLQRDCEEFLEVNYLLNRGIPRRNSCLLQTEEHPCLEGMGAGEGIIS